MRFLLLCLLFFTLFSSLLSAQEEDSLFAIERSLSREIAHQHRQASEIRQRQAEAQDALSRMEKRLGELSLAIYQQDHESFFYLSYYCHEVSRLSEHFFSKSSPFYRMGQRVQAELTRLRSLHDALEQSLKEDEQSEELREPLMRCLTLSSQLIDRYQGYEAEMQRLRPRFQRMAQRLVALDLYTNGRRVAGDDTRHQVQVSAEEMMRLLFGNVSLAAAPASASSRARGAEGVMAERLLEQLMEPQMRATALDQPTSDFSFFTQLAILPQQLAEQYGVEMSSRERREMLMILGFLIASGALIALLTGLVCRLCHRRYRGRLSENRLMALVLSAGVLLYALTVYVLSSMVELPYVAAHVEHLAHFLACTALLLLALSTRLATPRIGNGLALFVPLLLVNAALMLVMVLMASNSVVYVLSPLFYGLGALGMGWFFAFRMRRLRVSIRVFGFLSILFLLVASYGSYQGYAYLMIILSLFWYMLLVTVELLSCLSKCSMLLSRRLARCPSLHAYKSYVTGWMRLFTHYLLLPIGFLFLIWYSVAWSVSCLGLSRFFDTWMGEPYEFNTIIKSVSLSLILHMITVGIVTNCVLRLIQHTLVLLYDNKHEGGRKLTLLTVCSLLVWLGYTLYCLMLMRANYESILVILGGMSVGIGLGLKDNIENFICGISLLLGRLRLGDTVECGGHRGRVAHIGFRTTTVETRCGSMICFQNKELFNENFRNLTHNHQYERTIIVVGVAYGTDVSRARQVIMAALAPLHELLSQTHPYYVVLNDFGDSSVDLAVYIWLPVTGRSKARSSVREAIYTALKENEIEIPFPQRDLHLK